MTAQTPSSPVIPDSPPLQVRRYDDNGHTLRCYVETGELAGTILAATEQALLTQSAAHHRGIEAGPAYRVDAATVSYRLTVIQEARSLFLALQADRRSYFPQAYLSTPSSPRRHGDTESSC